MKNQREDLAAQMGRRRKSVAETMIPEDAGDEKVVSFICYLPESHRKALKRHSVEIETSMSVIVRQLIADYLKDNNAI